MKKSKSTLGALVIGITALCASCLIFSGVIGNGNIVDSERAVASFNQIDSGGSAEVRFYVSEEYRVVVTTDSNIQEHIEIKTANNVLSIGAKSKSSISPTKWIVDVYAPELIRVSLSGSGMFSSVQTLTASTFGLNLSGSGRAEGTIESENFSAVISGSGGINVNGNSTASNIHISGSGNFNGLEFNTKNATVRVSGSGRADVSVSDNLTANISGSGHIRYRGNPSVNATVTGSGRVTRL